MADQQLPTLQPPESGSTFDPMLEARVAGLEADVRNIRDTVGEMKIDLREVRSDIKGLQSGLGASNVNYATLSERIANLPTKSYIGWWITLGLSTAVVTLTILSRLGFLVAK